MEDKQPMQPPQRVTRYVYHLHGHAKLHSTNGESGPVVPFEVVIRCGVPVTDDSAIEELRSRVRIHIIRELHDQGSPYLVGDVMLRGVSHLHTIIVDDDDPEGPPARVIS